MSEVVSVYDATTQLSALLNRAEAGAEIVISRHGRSVARLSRFTDEAHPPQTPGRLRGQIRMAPDVDDVTEQDERDRYGE